MISSILIHINHLSENACVVRGVKVLNKQTWAYGEMDITRDFYSFILGSTPSKPTKLINQTCHRKYFLLLQYFLWLFSIKNRYNVYFNQTMGYTIFIILLLVFSCLLEYWIMNYKPKYIKYNNYIQVIIIIFLAIDILMLVLQN